MHGSRFREVAPMRVFSLTNHSVYAGSRSFPGWTFFEAESYKSAYTHHIRRDSACCTGQVEASFGHRGPPKCSVYAGSRSIVACQSKSQLLSKNCLLQSQILRTAAYTIKFVTANLWFRTCAGPSPQQRKCTKFANASVYHQIGSRGNLFLGGINRSTDSPCMGKRVKWIVSFQHKGRIAWFLSNLMSGSGFRSQKLFLQYRNQICRTEIDCVVQNVFLQQTNRFCSKESDSAILELIVQ